METIWDGGGLYTYLTSAGVLTVTSTDGDDAAAGTGARTVTVEGLDANYNQVSETLTVGGGVVVLSFQVFRAFVATSGSSGTNEGTISIAQGATTLAQIRTVGTPSLTGLGQTFMSIYTVPAGYTGYIFDWNVSTAKADGDVFLVKKGHNDNGTWRSQDVMHTNQNSIERNYKFPLKIEEKADIEVRALSPTNNMKCAATFCILLVQNDS